MFWITFGLLIVAGWQAWYFRKQLRVMADTLTATKEAVRETKLSDERQLRAYLSIRFTLLGEIDEGKTVEFKFVCQNHGATPAKDIEFRANRWRFNGDIPKNFKPEPIAGDWNDKRANVFPHASREDAEKMDFSCDLGIPALTKEEADAFLGRKNAWLIGLEIRYWDVFSDAPKYTREYYRVVINAKNGVNVSILPGASFVS
jgi:hypothetical protein